MRNVMNRKRHWLLLLLLSPFFLSCEDKMDEHYEKPEWLKGTAWEVLSNEYGGKFSMFLEAAELSGFKPILDGKSVATVMAPDNDAFAAYLEEHGYVSVKDIPTDDLKKLIGYHLIYYSYSKSDLENFRPEDSATSKDDDDDDELGVLQPGMYYKFRTHSTSPITKEVDPSTNNTVTVYHLERFLPVFSHHIFASKGIDAKKNYEFFYPNSTWTGDNGFNVSNASVKEYQIITNNGYIYNVDRVLEPLETIYDVLKKKSDYSDFLDFYSQYSTYAYDKDLSADYGKAVGVDSLFLHAHSPNGLPNIALEWPTPNFRLYPELASISYSIFAPSNQALNTFFNRYWKAGGYSSLTDLDPLITKILLYQSVYGGSIVFPDEISGITNSLGSHYDFQLSDVKDKSICVNGSFYGLSNFPMPEIFSTVMGPSFLKRDYLLSLYAIFQSNQMAAYTTTATNYTMLITKNSGYEISDMRLMSDGVGNILATSGEDGDVAVSTSDLKRIVSGGTVVGDVNFNTPWAVYATQDGGTYWFVKDGKMTTNYVFNSVLGQDPQTVIPTLFTEVKEVTNDAGGSWANGKVYEYESDFGVFGKLDGLEYTSLRTMLTSIGETKYPNFVFAYLMRQAELFATIDGVLAWDYRLAGRLIGFIPTNEVLKEALDNDRIPGVKGTIDLSLPSPTLQGEITNQYLLREYLLNYFFTPTNAPVASGCPYLGSPDWLSGEYRNSNNIPVKYTDNGAFITLQLQNQTTGQYGNACKIVSYENFPFAFMDGAFHLIDAVFN